MAGLRLNFVSIEFEEVGKLYNFFYENLVLRVGDYVVVRSRNGLALARVRKLGYDFSVKLKKKSLKLVVRKASSHDERGKFHRERSLEVARYLDKKYGLNLNILQVEKPFSSPVVKVYFKSKSPVGVHNFIRDFSRFVESSIEMKSLESREETKVLGGLGSCGRTLCCSTFLREFIPVSIKMAKVQNLALNPGKISGQCGRLKCCLSYEVECYKGGGGGLESSPCSDSKSKEIQDSWGADLDLKELFDFIDKIKKKK